MSKTPLKHWVLFSCLTLMWGTSFLQTALSLRSFTPEQIVVFRIVLAAIVLLMYLCYQGKRLPFALRDWVKFFGFALLGNILPYWLIASGQKTVSSGLAGLLMAIMPLITIVLAHWLIPNEQLNRYRLIGFAMGISGVTFVLWPSLISSNNSAFGAFTILIAASCYAVNTIVIRRYSHYDVTVMGTGVMVAGALLSVIIWPQVWLIEWQAISAVSAISLVWMGVVPTGLATIVFFVLLKQAGPTFVSNNNYVIPVVAYLCGALFLGETIWLLDLLALLVILLGIWISRFKHANTTASN